MLRGGLGNSEVHMEIRSKPQGCQLVVRVGLPPVKLHKTVYASLGWEPCL